MNTDTTVQDVGQKQPDIYAKNTLPRETYLREAAKFYPMATPVAVNSVMEIEDSLIAGGEISVKVALLHLASIFAKQPGKIYEFNGFSSFVTSRISADDIRTSFVNLLGKTNDAAIRADAEISGAVQQFNPDAQDMSNQFGITELQYQLSTYYLTLGLLDAYDEEWDMSKLATLMQYPAFRRSACMNLYDLIRDENEKMSKFVQETTLGSLYPFVLNEQVQRRMAKLSPSPIITPGTPGAMPEPVVE